MKGRTIFFHWGATMKRKTIFLSTLACFLSLSPAISGASETSGKDIYSVHISVANNNNSDSPLWKTYFQTYRDYKTPFESIQIMKVPDSHPLLMNTVSEWYGVKGWAVIEKDGLHYHMHLRLVGSPDRTYDGVVPGVKNDYRVSLGGENFSSVNGGQQ